MRLQAIQQGIDSIFNSIQALLDQCLLVVLVDAAHAGSIFLVKRIGVEPRIVAAVDRVTVAPAAEEAIAMMESIAESPAKAAVEAIAESKSVSESDTYKGCRAEVSAGVAHHRAVGHESAAAAHTTASAALRP